MKHVLLALAIFMPIFMLAGCQATEESSEPERSVPERYHFQAQQEARRQEIRQRAEQLNLDGREIENEIYQKAFDEESDETVDDT